MTAPVDRRATTDFPVMQRTGYKFLRRMANIGIAIFAGIHGVSIRTIRGK